MRKKIVTGMLAVVLVFMMTGYENTLFFRLQ